MAELSGWELLRSDLPEEALKPLPKEAYGISGLTDISDTHLLERLYDSKLKFSFQKPEFTFNKGVEVRKRGKPDEYKVDTHVVTCLWGIIIEPPTDAPAGIEVWAVGAHEDARIDVAMKGAQTSAFKAICKYLLMDAAVRKKGQVPEGVETYGNCPKCGKAVRQLNGKNGLFYSCTGWRKDGTGCSWSGSEPPGGEGVVAQTVKKMLNPSATAFVPQKTWNEIEEEWPEEAPTAVVPPASTPVEDTGEGTVHEQCLTILRSKALSPEEASAAFKQVGLDPLMTPAKLKALSATKANMLLEVLKTQLAKVV